ncbi:MAG TPA: DegT/DnrJ/EryC1/StrS family aminotransferase, partial [Anaerolineaceae bacterium]
RYFYPACHRMEPYRSYFPHAGLVLPETEKLVTKVMSLPNDTAVQSGDVRELCRVIAFCIENHREVSEAYRNVSQETVLR